MKHLDDIAEPTPEELAALEAEFDEEADFTGVDLPPHSADYDANQAEYRSRHQGPRDDDDSRRARLHRNARDITRIEHETTWAFMSKNGSFLGPKEARDKERD